jgi:hypothetical protein
MSLWKKLRDFAKNPLGESFTERVENVVRDIGERPFGTRGPDWVDIGTAGVATIATVLTAGAAAPGLATVIGGLAAGGTAGAGSYTARGLTAAMQQAGNAPYTDSQLSDLFEFNMPAFSFPAPPPIPEPPKAAAPPPTTDAAARRLARETEADRARRRTLSLFASSPTREGRSSTILTSSVGAPGTAPVRKRTLGGVSILGGAAA